jgi:hypothetical protein
VAFIHCAKALLRSELWKPESWLELDGLPSSARMLRDHVNSDMSEEAVAEALEQSYSTTMWWSRDDSAISSR